jgi:hypothetical protein
MFCAKKSPKVAPAARSLLPISAPCASQHHITATVRWLQQWLEKAGIRDGAIFRRLTGRGNIGDRLHEDSVSDIFKRVAAWIGMAEKQIGRVSGHSVRVGATQDLLALNIDLGSVMQAGRWKSTRMPMRYGEEVLAARRGMARAAEVQGRDERGAETEVARMQGKANPTPTLITLKELEQVITKCGGQDHAQTYAAPLLTKVRLLETRGTYRALLEPIRTARDQADLRGRLLELNLAYQFERAGFHPEVCAKQGGTGDMDFRFAVSGDEVFLETKLLRQDEATTTQINSQLAASNNFGVARSDDTEDIARLQRDLIQKDNPRKFDAVPKANWINLVGIDVSELQLGMVDVGDCLLAAGGNPVATAHCHDSVRRPNVVGVFERLSSMTPGQTKWASELDALVGSAVHPREYIHGAVFLFREPEDTAALVYKLTAAIVWNSALVTHAIARDLALALHQIVPHLMPRK